MYFLSFCWDPDVRPTANVGNTNRRSRSVARSVARSVVVDVDRPREGGMGCVGSDDSSVRCAFGCRLMRRKDANERARRRMCAFDLGLVFSEEMSFRDDDRRRRTTTTRVDRRDDATRSVRSSRVAASSRAHAGTGDARREYRPETRAGGSSPTDGWIKLERCATTARRDDATRDDDDVPRNHRRTHRRLNRRRVGRASARCSVEDARAW